MAIYKLQTGVDRIAGSRRGSTFQKAGTNYVLRKRAVPVQKRTPRQSVVKSRLGSISQRWRTLSGTNQTNWENEATLYPRQDSLGNTYYMRGDNLQSYANVNQVILNDSPIDTPEATPSFPGIIIDTIGIDNAFTIIEVVIDQVASPGDPTVPLGFSLKVFASRPVSPGNTVLPPPNLKLIATLPEGTDTTAVNLYDEWVAAFGLPSSYVGFQLTAAVQLVQAPGGIDGTLVSGKGDII